MTDVNKDNTHEQAARIDGELYAKFCDAIAHKTKHPLGEGKLAFLNQEESVEFVLTEVYKAIDNYKGYESILPQSGAISDDDVITLYERFKNIEGSKENAFEAKEELRNAAYDALVELGVASAAQDGANEDEQEEK